MFGGKEEILGVSCEHNRLSLTWVKGRTVKKAVMKEVPNNILSGAEIKSRNLFSGFLSDVLKENQISCKRVAYGLPSEVVFTRNVVLPKMDPEQIRMNVPYEFRDFIRGELNDYVFDYSYIADQAQTIGDIHKEGVHLFAVAVERDYLEQTVDMFSKAGLKLEKAMPGICSFENLLRLLGSEEERLKERCFLEIGHRHTQMRIYKNGRYKLMHMIDSGESRIVQAVADELNVDMHIAHTYLFSNYENCMSLPSVVNVYKDFSLEVLKGINFYEVSDMTARLGDMTICGSGAQIEPLVELLKTRVAMNVTTLDELLPDWNKGGALNVTAGSLGIALADGTSASKNNKKGEIKTSINFMAAEEKPSNMKYVVPAVAVASVAVVLFTKFAILDRFDHLEKAHARNALLEKEIEDGMKIISGAGALSERYHHYTWSDFTQEELERASRADVADLVTYIGNKTDSVRSYTLTEQDLSVEITAKSLEYVSRLAEDVGKRPIVESCTVVNAQSGMETTSGVVEAKLSVHLKNKSEAWKKKGEKGS